MGISLNFWAILAASIVYMVIGALWYGPLFGKQWRRLMGFSDAEMKTMPLTPWQAMGVALISALVMAYVLGRFAFVWGALDTVSALELAFWAWLGFLVPAQLGIVLWQGKSWTLFLLNAVQALIAIAAMAVILVRWM